jgi:hypothetical protein
VRRAAHLHVTKVIGVGAARGLKELRAVARVVHDEAGIVVRDHQPVERCADFVRERFETGLFQFRKRAGDVAVGLARTAAASSPEPAKATLSVVPVDVVARRAKIDLRDRR